MSKNFLKNSVYNIFANSIPMLFLQLIILPLIAKTILLVNMVQFLLS